MKKLEKNTKGITLVTLVITIVVLLILASIATYSGIEVIKTSRLTTFTTEMKIMQTQVNELYQRYKYGDNTVLDLGQDLNIVSEQANKVLSASGIIEQNEYRYFDQDTIKNLKIEGVEGEFFINIKTRSIISYDGFKYDDKIYYTLEQLPTGLYNVEYTGTTEEKPTFDTSVEEISEGKWKVTVSNIQYNGYINKWKVNYRLEGQDSWNTSEDLSFVVTKSEKIYIRLINSNAKSEEKEVQIYKNQQVEYIESTGTQYIDTGLLTNNNLISYIDVEVDNLSNEYEFLGTDSFTWPQYSVQLWHGSLYSFSNSRYVSDINTKRLKIISSNQAVKIEGYSDINRDINVPEAHPIYLCRWATNYSSFKLYGCKFYEDNVLVRDFIPCYRKSDTNEEIGLYDKVEKKFYTNQGTGTFRKGNDI